MTLSIAARCARTGQFGVAVTSSSLAVGARCAFVRAGVGAVATQNVTDPRLGPRGLDLLQRGATASDALATLLEEDPGRAYRQLALVDAAGDTAAFSGVRCYPRAATAQGSGVVAAGNLLAGPGIPEAMAAAFRAAVSETLPERLLACLGAGLKAGGEKDRVRSAGLVVADREAWPLVDLRVDGCNADPVVELVGLWRAWQPRMEDFVLRGVDPDRSTAREETRRSPEA